MNQITTNELIKILSQEIVKDDANKQILFFFSLLTYTPENTQNIIINSNSSTGKTHLAKSIIKFHSPQDVLMIASSSPRALFHEQGIYDKETNTVTIDFSNKILFFLDQPSPELLSTLRSLASHDAKELDHKIVDKNDRGGNRTKTVRMIGFPTIIYCTASKYIDSQELTRSILICPSMDQNKNREAIELKLRRATQVNLVEDKAYLSNQEKLSNHIQEIKKLEIKRIVFPQKFSNIASFIEIFHSNYPPKSQREIDKILGLAGGITLFNYTNRIINHKQHTISATEEDVEYAINLWSEIAEFQSGSIPANSLLVFQKAIKPLWEQSDKKSGLTKASISRKFYQETGEPLSEYLLSRTALQDLQTIGKIELKKISYGKEKVVFVI